MIRKSTVEDIEGIMPVYESAKAFMRSQGNLSQWTGGYPTVEVILQDIANGNHYVSVDDTGNILFVFTFIIGADPTYALIEDGQWVNDKPYGTIHRIASTASKANALRQCLSYCSQKIANIRIDTHADNFTMLIGLERSGFTRCGIIYTNDGSPRIAFQKEFPLSDRG